MGCPVPKVVNNGEGSALMKNPVLVGQIVEAMAKAVKKPVTVKILRDLMIRALMHQRLHMLLKNQAVRRLLFMAERESSIILGMLTGI